MLSSLLAPGFICTTETRIATLLEVGSGETSVSAALWQPYPALVWRILGAASPSLTQSSQGNANQGNANQGKVSHGRVGLGKVSHGRVHANAWRRVVTARGIGADASVVLLEPGLDQ